MGTKHVGSVRKSYQHQNLNRYAKISMPSVRRVGVNLLITYPSRSPKLLCSHIVTKHVGSARKRKNRSPRLNLRQTASVLRGLNSVKRLAIACMSTCVIRSLLFY